LVLNTFELIVVAIRLYEKVITKFRNTEGWSEEIDCNIGVKQGCPLFPTPFGIYIDKLEDCLEDTGCVGPKIKGNTPYPILLIEASLSPIESIVMIRYLTYKNKINNMDDKRLPKIASNSSQNHQQLKRGWHKM
jgi:hypothetical protein